MTQPQSSMNIENVVNLFFLFIIGTICFLVLLSFEMISLNLNDDFRIGLSIIGLFSYEIVIINLVSFYVTKAKTKFAIWFQRNPQSLYYIIASSLGLTYIVLNFIAEQSLLIFFRDFVLIGFMMFSLPRVHEFFQKRKQ